MSKKLNIEQLFSSKLEGLEQTPSPSAWKQTYRVVRRKQFFRFRAGRFNVYYAGVGLLLLAGLTYYLTAQVTESEKRDAQIYKPETPGEVIAPATDNSKRAEATEPVSNRSEAGTTSPEYQGQESGRQTKSNPEPGPGEQIQDKKQDQGITVPAPIAPNSGQTDAGPTKVNTLVPYFNPSVYEGCAPLTVDFVNASINASGISWNFGIPVSDYDPDKPRVTFTVPGAYMVILEAVNPEGLEKSYSEIITVHPGPDAVFEIDQGSVYNYSVDASAFSWYVLPEAHMTGTKKVQPFSSEFQPSLEEAIDLGRSLYYKEPFLHLVASNTFGCTDTVSSILPEGTSPELIFPTAFSPNPNGSIGGYYNPNDPDNQVFHPNFNEVPESYHLRIMNKSGTLVFETNEIYIGWDGYYQEERAPGGVYIYLCNGTWKNGKPFQYRGDITILWNDR